MPSSKHFPRIAIVGAGYVGSTTAYALLLSGTAAEIVLIDSDRRRAEAHVEDLRDAEVFAHSTRIVAGELADCGTADVVIVTAGLSQAGAKSRLHNLEESAAILEGIVREVARHDPQGILLIASNPVDVLTYAAWRWSGLPPNRVIGSGTSLDTSRFRWRLARQLGVASDNVHAYIIGEHGDTQVPAFSAARVAGMALDDFCRELTLRYDEAALKTIARETRTAGLEIIEGKGATYYGIATALARIVRAIVRDEHAVLTVSGLAPSWMSLGEVCLSLPSIVGREGVTHVMPVPLSPAERQNLEASAELLKRHIAALHLPAAP